MQYSPFWEAKIFSASQEIIRILLNPKFHHRIHKCPPPVHTLSHLDPVQTSTSHLLRSIVPSHLSLSLPSGPIPSGFANKSLYTPQPSPYMLHVRPSHSSPFEHPNNAAHKNDFVANLSDVASSSCDALTWASSEYCRKSGSNAVETLSYRTHITASSLTVTCVYITLTEKPTNMTNVHAQCFSVNNQLLLPNLKAFSQFTRSLQPTRNASCFQSVSSSRTVCRCHQSLYSCASHSQHPRTTSDTPTTNLH